MEPILIKPDSSLLNEQYRFLIHREFYIRYNWYKKAVFYLLAWIVLLIGFSFLTDPETLVTFKVVLLFTTALAFVIAVIFALTIIAKWLKRQSLNKARIKDIVENKLNYWLAFDETQISFSTETYGSNIKWEYYKYYKENKDSLYIFPASSYDAIACSKTEIGERNYDLLKDIVIRKLIAENSKEGT
jgi:hypothetical protein